MERIFQLLIKPLSYPLIVMFICFVAVFLLMIRVVTTFGEIFLNSGGRFPASTSFLFAIAKRLQFLNHPWVIFLILPLYFGLAALYGKGYIKMSRFIEWILILIFGIGCGFITYAMYMPMFELGNLAK